MFLLGEDETEGAGAVQAAAAVRRTPSARQPAPGSAAPGTSRSTSRSAGGRVRSGHQRGSRWRVRVDDSSMDLRRSRPDWHPDALASGAQHIPGDTEQPRRASAYAVVTSAATPGQTSPAGRRRPGRRRARKPCTALVPPDHSTNASGRRCGRWISVPSVLAQRQGARSSDFHLVLRKRAERSGYRCGPRERARQRRTGSCRHAVRKI